jgi:ribonucleoside-diphosphate reductase alpha chain
MSGVEKWLGQNNELGIDIWNKKYRYKNESFEQWLDRVSGGDEKLRKLISEKKFLFGGRTLANRGTDKKGSFSNCYSRGFIEDDLEDIMKAGEDIAKTFKAQGGQGLSLSKLRPKGCGINNGQFSSDGIIPFMEIYNRITESISQGGSRKGALIMSLDIWHKEAPDFIKIKSEQGRIEKANLSLEIDNTFMESVKKYYETGEIDSFTIYREYNGNGIQYQVTPIELYKLMMEKAWEWGEPGCLFVDRFRKYNLMEYDDEYKIEVCNPCGEQPLPKHGACNLGSINLSEFVRSPFTPNAEFDSYSFAEAVSIAIEALDNVLDENLDNHPLVEQREMAYNYRNVGLGIMGLHDALIKLGITYGSTESKGKIENIMDIMFRQAVLTSNKLAKEKGAFPKYSDKVLESEIIKYHFKPEEIEELRIHGLRNCSLLSIAPSGSIGTMLNISTGCEPLFQISYNRKTESLAGEDKYYKVYSGIAQEFINATGQSSEKNIILPEYFNTSSDIHWFDRLQIQGILQNHVDTAISSTINLPEETTQEDIEQLYLYAWGGGLKGVTIFRDGCKRLGILTTKDNSKSVNKLESLKRGEIVKVNNKAIGRERHLNTGCGTLHCAAFFHPTTGELLEVYLSKGSKGGCQSNLAAVSRLVSLSARAGVPVEAIVDQLQSCMACPAYAVRTATKHDTSKGNSCPVAVGNALMDMYKEIQEELRNNNIPTIAIEENSVEEIINKEVCPECGEDLVVTGGCISCMSCGWSKCE